MIDFPAIALLTKLGIEPLTICVAWFGWQLVKINKEIKATLDAHGKRLDKVEWEQEKMEKTKG